MRADQDLDVAVGDAVANRLRLARLALHQRRQQLHTHVRHPREQAAVVLRREHRRRREQRHLATAADGAVDGAHGDLGLAKADIAAHEPVHWLLHLHHVVRHLVEGALLVGRGLVREGRREGRDARVGGVGRARLACELLALGVHGDEVRGDVPDLFRRALLALLPALARAHPVELDGLVGRLDVLLALEELEVLGGIPGKDLEKAVLELDFQRLERQLGPIRQQLERLAPEDALKEPNAVVLVHNEVASPNLALG